MNQEQISVTTADIDSEMKGKIIKTKKKNEKSYLNVLTADTRITSNMQNSAKNVDTALKVDNLL